MRDLRENVAASSVETKSTKTQVLNLEPNLAGLLCYAPLVGLISSLVFFFTEPRSNKFVRFHAIQSLLLTVAGLVPSIVLSILAGVGLGVIASLLSTVVSIALLAACVICMIQAWNNQLFKLPVIGDIAIDNA